MNRKSQHILQVLLAGCFLLALLAPGAPARATAQMIERNEPVMGDPVGPAPDPVNDLAVTREGDGDLDLGWSAVSSADSYLIYRSTLSGGGYQQVGITNGTSYTDSGLQNAQTYYYVVVSRDDTTMLVSGYSNEASGMPHYDLTNSWYNVQWPFSIDHTVGLTPTENIYGQIWIEGVTELDGAPAALRAQVGFGPTGSDPTGWTDWVEAGYNTQAGNNDEYVAQLLPEQVGTFDYVYRYTVTDGRAWVYGDQDGPFTGIPTSPGMLTVHAGSDTTPPDAPQNLAVTGWSSDHIALAWDPLVGDDSLYAYDVYRSQNSAETGQAIARVLAPTSVYTDTAVSAGVTYYYRVRALDTSFNRSAFSNQAAGTAQARPVAVTFRVQVPDYTPGTVYLADSFSENPLDPAAQPMTQTGNSPQVWEITLEIPDGTEVEYKYTRGSWETVEEWGSLTDTVFRNVTVDYGTDGTQLVDDTDKDWGNGSDDHKAVQGWHDPLVIAHSPLQGQDGVPVNSDIQIIWNHSMPADIRFTVSGPDGVVSGAFSYQEATRTASFKPWFQLEGSQTYTVTVSGQVDAQGREQQIPEIFSFTTAPVNAYKFYLPLVAQNLDIVPADRAVAVKFTVRVPEYTPGAVYLMGDMRGYPKWDPQALLMEQTGPQTWQITLHLLDKTQVNYRYTRGSLQTVEDWGSISDEADRQMTVHYGTTATQTIDDTAVDWGQGPDDHKAVRDWLDPIVVQVSPANLASQVPVDTKIQVAWSHAMDPKTRFALDGPQGPVAGAFAYNPETYTITFTPAAQLEEKTSYTIRLQDQVDADGDLQQVGYTSMFTTRQVHFYQILPLIPGGSH